MCVKFVMLSVCAEDEEGEGTGGGGGDGWKIGRRRRRGRGWMEGWKEEEEENGAKRQHKEDRC